MLLYERCTHMAHATQAQSVRPRGHVDVRFCQVLRVGHLNIHLITAFDHSFNQSNQHLSQVAARLEAVVDKALDAGYRTKDIYKEVPGTKFVKCSEMGELLLNSL